MQDAERFVKKEEEVGRKKEKKEVGVIINVFRKDYFKIWIGDNKRQIMARAGEFCW